MKLARDGRTLVVPDFLIIGAAKSGTTSLYHYLDQHPDVFFSSGIKEPGYFCFADRPYRLIANGLPDLWKTAVTSLDEYLDLFRDAPPHAVVGEATPEYLLLPDPTIANLAKVYGDDLTRVRFIAVLRNPIDRIWSNYWMMVRDGYENQTFEVATDPGTIAGRLDRGWHPCYDYRGFGTYGRQLGAYLERLDRNQFRVVLFEELARDPATVCRELFDFLGVDASLTPDVSVRHNVSGRLKYPRLHHALFGRDTAPKRLARLLFPTATLQRVKARVIGWNINKVPMRPEQRLGLAALYEEDIHRLGSVLGRDLSHWFRGEIA
jgi:hypothetical protein